MGRGDGEQVAATLLAAGMTAEQAAAKAAMRDGCLQAMEVRKGATARFVPGRIEFLGKHTDYCGGRSLVCTTEQGFIFVVAPRDDGLVQAVNADTGERIALRPSMPFEPKPGTWEHYVRTAIRRATVNFPSNRWTGMELAFSSDLPQAAGLSSSIALIVGTFLAFADVNDFYGREEYRDAIRSREDLAGYLGCIENGQSFGPLAGSAGVGTFGGSQDHTAMLCSRGGELVQYGFCPVRFERSVRLPDDHCFIIASSGVVASKTAGAMAQYNNVSAMAQEAVRLWNQATGRRDPTLAAIIRGGADAESRLLDVLAVPGASARFSAADLRARVQQFAEESERIIPAAAAALERSDLAELGRLVALSQQHAECGLKNQVEQTIELARSAVRLGAAAASAFGAGFGGSVWALVPKFDAQSFAARWETDYRAGAGSRVTGPIAFFSTIAAPSAMRCDGPPAAPAAPSDRQGGTA